MHALPSRHPPPGLSREAWGQTQREVTIPALGQMPDADQRRHRCGSHRQCLVPPFLGISDTGASHTSGQNAVPRAPQSSRPWSVLPAQVPLWLLQRALRTAAHRAGPAGEATQPELGPGQGVGHLGSSRGSPTVSSAILSLSSSLK